MRTSEKKTQKPADNGNELLVTGAGVGVMGVVGAAVIGVTCPACVVVAPALVGAGLYKKWNNARKERAVRKAEEVET